MTGTPPVRRRYAKLGAALREHRESSLGFKLDEAARILGLRPIEGISHRDRRTRHPGERAA